MLTIRLPARPHTTAQRAADARTGEEAVHQEQTGPLDGELLDLYAAIAIAVPLALFLRSLWP